MSRPDFSAVTAQELTEIARRAREALDLYDEDDDPRDSWGQKYGERCFAAWAALRFVASAAPVLGVTSVLPDLAQGISLTEESSLDLRADRLPSLLNDAFRMLTPLVGAVTPELAELTRARSAVVRQTLASGLRPFDDAAVALLRGLAADPEPEVRVSARQSLGPDRAPPAWWGLVLDDPLVGLPSDEAAPLAAALAQALAIWETPPRKLAPAAELAEAVASLPELLLGPLAEQLLLRRDLADDHMSALANLLISQVGSDEATLRLCRAWAYRDHYRHGAHQKAVASPGEIPTVRREAICLRLLDFVCEPLPERTTHRHLPFVEREAACIMIAALWPAEVSPRAVLEAVLGCPLERAAGESKRQYSIDPRDKLREVFARDDLDLSELLPLLLEARDTDYPGAWESIPHTLKERLGRFDDPRKKAKALATLESGLFYERWHAMSFLIGEGHDPEQDPPVEDLLDRFYEDPMTRATFFAHHQLLPRRLPRARAELRLGRLSFEEAKSVLKAIKGVEGGASSSVYDERETSVEPSCPEDLRGPITAEEWEIYRALRTAYVRQLDQGFDPMAGLEEDECRSVKIARMMDPFGPLSEGPWHPEDLVWTRRIIEDWKGDPGKHFDYLLDGLRRKPAPETDDLIVEVVTAALESGNDWDLADLLRDLREGKLPARAVELIRRASGTEVRPSSTSDWMDDDEEE
jgi:hypothetical protein